MGNKEERLQALIKRSGPEAMWTYNMTLPDSLATKELCPELGEVMATVIRTVNYIKTCASESKLFAELCELMRAQYRSLLFYCNTRRQSRGSIVALVYNLREKVALFL